MNRSVLSETLNGAAFPAVILALAVSQINVDPGQRSTRPEGKTLPAEIQWDNLAEQKATKAQGH
jgi:hypothetical protein